MAITSRPCDLYRYCIAIIQGYVAPRGTHHEAQKSSNTTFTLNFAECHSGLVTLEGEIGPLLIVSAAPQVAAEA